MSSKTNSIGNINEKVLLFLKSNPEGVSQEKLTSGIPFKEELIVESINTLVNLNRINIIESSEGMLFKYRSEKEALKFRDLSKEEIAVYEVVMQSGSSGISTIDIKIKLKIDNKKVWMGIDIEPSQEITGGIWCNEQEVDDNLVSVFSEKCLEYISTQKQISRKELLMFAKSSNLMKNSSEIKEDDIQKILNILVFDGKIEPIFPINIDNKFLGNKYALLLDKEHPDINNVKYRKNIEYKMNNIFDYLPCFVCPAFKECKKDNVVNPIECPYNKELFNLNED